MDGRPVRVTRTDRTRLTGPLIHRLCVDLRFCRWVSGHYRTTLAHAQLSTLTAACLLGGVLDGFWIERRRVDRQEVEVAAALVEGALRDEDKVARNHIAPDPVDEELGCWVFSGQVLCG